MSLAALRNSLFRRSLAPSTSSSAVAAACSGAAAATTAATTSSARWASSSSGSPSTASTSTEGAAGAVEVDGEERPAATHYHLTLMRAATRLPSSSSRTLQALGLGSRQKGKRLSSVLVPINGCTAGQVLRVKELVRVQTVHLGEMLEMEAARRGTTTTMAAAAGARNEQEGRTGAGLRLNSDRPGAVIRVGNDRARGDERGFRVVGRL